MKRVMVVASILLMAVGAQESGRAIPSSKGTDPEIDRRSFSNTQAWEPDYLKLAGAETQLLPKDWIRKLDISPPPANSSPRTRAELDELLALHEQRRQRRADVERELLSDGFRFGEHSYRTFIKGDAYPKTQALFASIDHDLSVVIFTLKQRFNRIRPSILDRKVGHLFPIPRHPAYPSGHSTQAFTIAFLLSELDPANSKRYAADALQIARNREIAGFHYPSDSEAGQKVARQFVDILLEHPTFNRLLAEARREW